MFVLSEAMNLFYFYFFPRRLKIDNVDSTIHSPGTKFWSRRERLALMI